MVSQTRRPRTASRCFLGLLAVAAGAPACRGWEGDVILARGASGADAAPGIDAPSAGDAPLASETMAPIECPPETREVRLLFADGRLATFHADATPATLTNVLQLSCGISSSAQQTPPSFAVDRHGDVWLLDENGTLFTIPRGTGTCIATGFDMTKAGGPFRMAFVADAGAPDKETLFIAVGTNKSAAGVPQNSELAALNLVGLPTAGARVTFQGWPMLTGTGDLGAGKGSLWGLFPSPATAMVTQNPRLKEISPETGALGPRDILEQAIVSPDLPRVVAWRGDFWIFVSGSRNLASRVSGVNGSPLVHADLGTELDGRPAELVAAAVSTCAPVR